MSARHAGPRILVLDNYDSFTFNLVQDLGRLGAEVEVARNDEVTATGLRRRPPDGLLVSPGPGTPEQAGASVPAIRALDGRIPILGVCLGHQSLAHAFGGRITRARRILHGKTSEILHGGRGLFTGLENPFPATRYHSLEVTREHLPEDFEVAAWTADDEIMAIRRRRSQSWGVQFHPESILTRGGSRLLENWLSLCARRETAPESSDLQEALDKAVSGRHLDEREAQGVMEALLDGKAAAPWVAGWLVALRTKGETPEEIAGFARALRRHAASIHCSAQPLVDTCGTGGDGAHTFNISTAAALVAAGAGVHVAKHGNRSVSSRCGSADVLEALGVRLEVPPGAVAEAVDTLGFGFLFAPRHHQAMRHAVEPRRALGLRTVFNVLGPLANPAGAPHQVLGVFDEGLMETMAEVLRRLGVTRALLVHGRDGLDEVSVCAPTRILVVQDDRIEEEIFDPRALGMGFCAPERLVGGDAAENAAILRRVLEGEQGPRRDVVLLNAAAALRAAGRAADFETGVEVAARAVDEGRAREVLQRYVDFTRQRGEPA